jgi:hypothetical protein
MPQTFKIASIWNCIGLFWISEKQIIEVTSNCLSNIIIYTVMTSCLLLMHSSAASHKPNRSSVPRGIADSYSTLPWVTREAVTVVEGIPWWGLLRHTLANGASGLPKPRWKVSCQWLHGTGVETAVSLTILLGNMAAPHCKAFICMGLHGQWPYVFPHM